MNLCVAKLYTVLTIPGGYLGFRRLPVVCFLNDAVLGAMQKVMLRIIAEIYVNVNLCILALR